MLREQAPPPGTCPPRSSRPDIPCMFNMKKVKITVANIINGRPVTNGKALVNPESLDHLEKLLSELQKD